MCEMSTVGSFCDCKIVSAVVQQTKGVCLSFRMTGVSYTLK